MTKSKIKINIGDSIKKGLKRKGLAAKDLAEMMGVSQNLVYKWLSNQRTPTGEDLIILAMKLDIVDTLFSKSRKKQITSQEIKDEMAFLREKMRALEEKVNQCLQCADENHEDD